MLYQKINCYREIKYDQIKHILVIKGEFIIIVCVMHNKRSVFRTLKNYKRIKSKGVKVGLFIHNRKKIGLLSRVTGSNQKHACKAQTILKCSSIGSSTDAYNLKHLYRIQPNNFLFGTLLCLRLI